MRGGQHLQHPAASERVPSPRIAHRGKREPFALAHIAAQHAVDLAAVRLAEQVEVVQEMVQLVKRQTIAAAGDRRPGFVIRSEERVGEAAEERHIATSASRWL